MAHFWKRSTLRAVWETLKAPQWGLLVLVCALGLAAEGDAAFVVTIGGLIIALLLCIWAFGSLGYDGTNLLKVLFSFSTATWKQSLLALAFVGAAFLTVLATSRVESLAQWFMEVIPATLAPAPDLTLMIVQIVCVVFFLFVLVTSFVRKRAYLRAINDPILDMPRRERRANKVTQANLNEIKEKLRTASLSRDYWREASTVLALAAIAVLPGALGWSWILGALFSVALPMFVLSVQFRKS